MEQLTTTSILSLLETTKEQRQSFVEDIVQRIEQGEADPIKVLVQLKCHAELVDNILSDVRFKSLALDEGSKYGKQFEKFNAKIAIKEVGVKYDYTDCDTELDNLMAQKALLDEKIKKRQKVLQVIDKPVADSETGDLLQPAVKTSTTSLVVTLK